MKSHPIVVRSAKSQGTIHIIVLMSALIVAVVGLSSVQVLRLQARTSAGHQDFTAARFHARAALELGLLKIRNDPYWRKNLGNGNWLTNVPLGTGTGSVSATDPIDNDVTKGDNHPVVLTGTGKQGSAVFMTSVRLEVGPPKNSCLEVSMISGDVTDVSGGTIVGDQTVCANNDFSAGSGAQVNADVEAFDVISGGSYGKMQTKIPAARTMPDSANVLSYYLTNGTTISYASLSSWPQPEILTNTTFESDTSGWTAQGSCVLSRKNGIRMSGNSSLSVSNRADAACVAAQSFAFGTLRNGDTYRLLLPFYCKDCNAQAVLTLTSSGDGVQTLKTPLQAVPNSTWTTLTGTVTPTWTGTLTKATFTVSVDTNYDYYIDDVSLTNVTYPAGSYALLGLLSPSVNPFGATNSQGIYVINCAGHNVFIGRSRIVGTVVLLNPGSSSAVTGPTIWEPAVYNYPALLSNDTINIATSSAGFNEETFGANLNPPGTPYPFNGGVANATLTDSYPAKITGLIYSDNDLKFSQSPVINGVVIARDDITINSATLTLNYRYVYLNEAPPGFDSAGATMKVVPGTWKRKVN